MPVFFFDLKQEKLYVTFGAEEDRLGPVLAQRNAILLQVQGCIQQTTHDVDQLGFLKVAILQLFLLNGSFQGEVIVVAVGVNFFMFDADLIF